MRATELKSQQHTLRDAVPDGKLINYKFQPKNFYLKLTLLELNHNS